MVASTWSSITADRAWRTTCFTPCPAARVVVSPRPEERHISHQNGKRLIVVSSHFPPDRSAGTHRVLRFANDFQRSGWSTVVLTVDPAAYRHNIPIDEQLCARVDPALTISRTGALRGLTAIVRMRRLLGGNPGQISGAGVQSRREDGKQRFNRAKQFATNLFSFPDEEIGWFAPAVMRGLRLVRRHSTDVVLSSGPPFTNHLIAHAMKSLSKVKWVADFRDPWARAPWGKPGSPRAHRWLERMTIGAADAVILNTPELYDDFARAYGPAVARKFHVVTNGYEHDMVASYASQQPADPPPLVLTHAGTLYGTRNPLPLLQALARCHGDGRVPRGSIRLQLVGKIASYFDVAAWIERLNLGDIVATRPPISHHACLEVLAASHVLVVIQPGTALQVPAKLYECIGLRRPILALAEPGGVTRVIREAECGLSARPDDVGEIADALHHLWERYTSIASAVRSNPIAARFDAHHQFSLLRGIVCDLTEPGGVVRQSLSIEA